MSHSWAKRRFVKIYTCNNPQLYKMKCPHPSIQKTEKHEEIKKHPFGRHSVKKVRTLTVQQSMKRPIQSAWFHSTYGVSMKWTCEITAMVYGQIGVGKICSAISCHGVSLCWTWIRRPYPRIHQNQIVVCKILEKRHGGIWKRVVDSRDRQNWNQ